MQVLVCSDTHTRAPNCLQEDVRCVCGVKRVAVTSGGLKSILCSTHSSGNKPKKLSTRTFATPGLLLDNTQAKTDAGYVFADFVIFAYCHLIFYRRGFTFLLHFLNKAMEFYF